MAGLLLGCEVSRKKNCEVPKSSPKKVLEIFRSEFSFPSEEENTSENEDKKIM